LLRFTAKALQVVNENGNESVFVQQPGAIASRPLCQHFPVSGGGQWQERNRLLNE